MTKFQFNTKVDYLDAYEYLVRLEHPFSFNESTNTIEIHFNDIYPPNQELIEKVGSFNRQLLME